MRGPLKQSYDVIIVGAGPAGATLGYELARKGIEVLILEKEKLPPLSLSVHKMVLLT